MSWIRQRLGIVALVVAVLVFCGCWYASPYWTCGSIVKAVEDKNVKELSQYIDYPAVRNSLKVQLNNKIKVQLEEKEKNPLALLGAVFTAPLVDALVDELVTPAGISKVLNGERSFLDLKSSLKPSKHTQTQKADNKSGNQRKEAQSQKTPKIDWKANYGSNMDEFSVTLTRQGKPKSPVTVSMVREGFFSWKINNVLIPFKF